LQAQLAVGEFIGVPLSVVRSMDIDEFYLWLEWMKLKAKKSGGGAGKSERRKLR
jgi:hypothetical protein